MKKTKRAFSGAERGRQNTLPDLRLEALVNEVSEIVQDRQISEILSSQKSRGGHCAAATEAVWAIIKADPRFEGLKVKIQILKPLNPENDKHYRIYDVNEDVYYDPTSYQFTTPFETLYDPDDKSKTRFRGLSSMRTEAPYTNRFSTLTIIDEFYKRFPHEKKIKVLSDTREGPRLQLVSEVVISSADAPLFANAYNLIGQEVEVHTNRTKKIWSIKDPNDNDKLIGYAKDTVVLKNVTWTQPSLGVARRTFHKTDTGARTGERSVQAFAQGILVAFDDLPVPHEIKSEMSQCEPIKLTYRPTNDAPAWVGAFRDRNTREGVSTSKFAKLDWVNLPDGNRVADAKAYGEIIYIDSDELEDFRQLIIRENGKKTQSAQDFYSNNNKKQFIKNPLMTPRADSVDTFFEVVMVALKEFIQYCRSLPKSPKISAGLIDILPRNLNNFIENIQLRYRDIYISEYEIKEYIKKIDRYGTLFLYGIYSCTREILKLSINLSDKDIIEKRSSEIVEAVKDIMNFPLTSDYYSSKLKALKSMSIKFIKTISLFCPEITVYMGDTYEESVDKFIDEFKPELPDGWIERGPSPNSNTRWYELSAGLAEDRYGLDRIMTVKVENLTDFLGACAHDEDRYYIKIYCLPCSLNFTRVVITPEQIYQAVLHESVHLMQACLSGEIGSFRYTGLPYERAQHYMQHLNEAEAILKMDYQIKGLDPDLVDFYRLDDVEFYSLLLDQVIQFIKINFIDENGKFSPNICTTVIDKSADDYINNEKFFRVLRHFQTPKYELAVQEFKQAVIWNFHILEDLYVCKIRDARNVRKK